MTRKLAHPQMMCIIFEPRWGSCTLLVMCVRVTDIRYSSCGLFTPCSFRMWFMMAQFGHTQPLRQSLGKCKALVLALKSLLLWITVMDTVLDAVVSCDLCHEKTHCAVAEVCPGAMLSTAHLQQWMAGVVLHHHSHTCYSSALPQLQLRGPKVFVSIANISHITYVPVFN